MQQTTLVYVVLGVFIIGRFLVRELRERTLGNAQLFILPIIIWLVAALVIAQAVLAAPDRTGQLALESLVTVPIGLIIGYFVARFTTVRILPDGRTRFRGSYVTVAIWILTLLLRVGVRLGAGQASLQQSLNLNAALLVLVATALSAVRYFVWRKAKQERLHHVALAETAV